MSTEKLVSVHVSQRSSGPLISWSEQEVTLQTMHRGILLWLGFSDLCGETRTLFSSTVPSGISNFTPDLAVMVTLPCRWHQQ
jgi:hypothetical protein